MKKSAVPDCFGSQGESALYGEAVTACLECESFEQCHKITVAVCLQALADGFDLMVQNGLSDGRLKCWEELEKLGEKELRQGKK